MKRIVVALVSAAVLLSIQSSARAGVGVYAGGMETETLGTGIVGGLELTGGGGMFGLTLRIGVAGEFDEFEPGGIFNRDKEFVESNRSWSRRYRDWRDDWRDDTIDFTVIPLEAGFYVSTAGMLPLFDFYAAAGVGYYCLDWGDDNWMGYYVRLEDVVGFWALGGVEVGVGPVQLFAEVKYLNGDEDQEFTLNDKTEMINLDLSGTSVLVGLRVHF